jgi:hypothetical protein
MATEFGSNSLAPHGSIFFFFAKPGITKNFLPYISVIPTSPSFTPGEAGASAAGLPEAINQLGASPVWSRLSDDASGITYYISVQNNSNSTVEFSFVEADF